MLLVSTLKIPKFTTVLFVKAHLFSNGMFICFKYDRKPVMFICRSYLTNLSWNTIPKLALQLPFRHFT